MLRARACVCPPPLPPAAVPRVWPKPVEGTAACGLAVARAFGDVAWKAAGVCAAPDVVVRALQPADAFVLLCSDGVTDAMSGAAAVTCAADALHRGAGAGGGGGGGRGGGRAAAEANAAAAVVEAAKKAWAQRFPRHARDDITALVVLLRPLAAGGDAR